MSPAQVKGIGFDATCSLAVVDHDGHPMSVSRTGEDGQEADSNLGIRLQSTKDGEGEWNVVLWADHRAEAEADTVNATGEGLLNFVGKTMSVR